MTTKHKPFPTLTLHKPAASCALLAHGHGNTISYSHIDKALHEPDTHLRLFGKPEIQGERRLGVIVCLAENIKKARKKAVQAKMQIEVTVT